MTKERLKEIEDSINLQLVIAEQLGHDGLLIKEEKELFDYTIKVMKLYDKAMTDLVKESKKAMDLKTELQEAKDSITWWTNRYNAIRKGDNNE